VLTAARATLKSLGGLDGSLYLLGRLLQRMSLGRARLISYRLVAQPVAEGDSLPPKRAARFEVRRLLPLDADYLPLPRPRGVIESRFRQGADCFGAFRGGELVGFIWLRLGPFVEDEVRCVFEPRPVGITAWDFDVWVRPDLRFSPLFARLWDEANRYLRAHGVRWTLSRIAGSNVQSVASHRRLGARFLGRATFLAMGPMQIMLANLAPYVHVSCRRGAPWPRLRPRAPQ